MSDIISPTKDGPLKIHDNGDGTFSPVVYAVGAGGGGGGGGAVTVADAADVTQGATTDTAVVADVNGTISGKLRGLVKIFSDVWDSTNHRIAVTLAPLSSSIDSVTTVASITRPLTPTLTQVVSSALSVTILAANSGRNFASVFNDSTAILYLSPNAAVAASVTIHTVQIPASCRNLLQMVFTRAR